MEKDHETTPIEEVKEEKKVDNTDYSCPNCSGPLTFNPQTSTLICSYCGYKEVLNGKKSSEEKDFLSAEKDLNTWSKEAKVLKCKNCGAENVISNQDISQTCPFCGSNQVVESDELVGLKPDRVVPFIVSEEASRKIYEKWITKKAYAPKAVKKNVPYLKINGVYLPCWTYDSDTTSVYVGQLGEHYTVVVGSGKNAHTETRTRWFKIKGTELVTFDDILIDAGQKITDSELTKIAPFQTNDSYIYDERYLVGFTAEHYVVNVQQGWTKAQEKTKPSIRASILSHYHYDVVGSLDVKTTFDNIKYKYVLLPIWIGQYTYEKKDYRFIINGENTKISGKFPISKVKVALTVLVIIIVVIGIMLLYLYANE